jgi:hypothetical protein
MKSWHVGLIAATIAIPCALMPPVHAANYVTAFCPEVVTYEDALHELMWAIPTTPATEVRALQNRVRQTRSAAWRAIRTDGSTEATSLASAWRIHHYYRASLGKTAKWQNAAAKSDRLVQMYCSIIPQPASFL